jgi:hypothetical protein
MRDHEMYGLYEAYVSGMDLPAGKRSLLLISGQFFDEFTRKCARDVFFRLRNQSIFREFERSKKIRTLKTDCSDEVDKDIARTET